MNRNSRPSSRPSRPPTVVPRSRSSVPGSRTGAAVHAYSNRTTVGGGSRPPQTSRKIPRWVLVLCAFLVLAVIGIVAVWQCSRDDSIESNGSSPSETTIVQTLSGPSNTQENTNINDIQTSFLPQASLAPTNGDSQNDARIGMFQPKSELFQLYDPSLRWYLSYLSVHELKLFSTLYDGIATQEKEISLPAGQYTQKQLERVLTVIRLDCPELIHFDIEGTCSCTLQDEWVVSVTPSYQYNEKEESLQAVSRVLEKVRELLAATEKASNTAEREYQCYREIIRMAKYDKESEHCVNADGVFLYAQGKCTAFSSAFSLVCRCAGIPCIRVIGEGTNSAGTDAHSWNYVQLEGEWYICDPTWDNGLYQTVASYPSPISDTLCYLNLTSAETKKTHLPDEVYKKEKWSLPTCTATEFSYWNAFYAEKTVGKDWQNEAIRQLNDVIAGTKTVVALHFEESKYFEQALSGYQEFLEKWMKDSGNYCTYRFVSMAECQTLWLFQVQPVAENPYQQQNLWVRFLDVGDADAAIVYCEGHYLLIDGGTSNNSRFLYSYLQSNGISYVDAVVVTHPHSDHAGGLCGAFSYEGCEFGVLYSSVKDSDNSSFRELLKKAAARNTPLVVPDVGDDFALGSATVTFLSPPKDKNYENTNNKSLVLRIEYGDKAFLFTGDAMENAERDMLANGLDLSADVLKVGHHGAAASSCQEFLDAVQPSIAVISCAESSSEHPHPETLKRLQQTGCLILRTDEKGEITIFTDGKTIWYTTEK